MNGMKKQNRWEGYHFVGLDANIFSYHFHQDPLFGPLTKEIFDLLSLNRLRAVTSIITLIEILSVKASSVKIKGLKKLFSEIPNLAVVEVDEEIADKTALIRRNYGFRTPDAIQLATALRAKAKVFITNDETLKKLKELKVILLKDL